MQCVHDQTKSEMKTRLPGMIAVALLAGPAGVQADPVYVGTGQAPGTYQQDVIVIDPSSPSGQIVGATCSYSDTIQLLSINADVGIPAVTTQIHRSIVATYVSGPRPEVCQSSEGDFPFAFRNVTASDLGISGSNSVGTVVFAWHYNSDRTSLSGPISFESGAVGQETHDRCGRGVA